MAALPRYSRAGGFFVALEPAMNTLRTILHPTDFSEDSEHALWVARSLARDHDARLIILHVSPIESWCASPEEVHSYLTISRDALEEARGQVQGPDLQQPVELLLKTGTISTGILNTADECACDLIVMGTRGTTGLGRALIGSTAEAVMRQSRCPVLALRLPGGKRDGNRAVNSSFEGQFRESFGESAVKE
jgi:nucleotide-binding universal stress UspA family protein